MCHLFNEGTRKDGKSSRQVKRYSAPKRYWNKMVHFFAHFEDYVINKDDQTNEDPATQIQNYIDGLGADINAGERTDFVCVCYDSLRGDGDRELQRKILNTLSWRDEQLHLTRSLIEHLEHKGLIERRNAIITKFRKPKDDISSKVYSRLLAIPGVSGLIYPEGDDKIHSFFSRWDRASVETHHRGLHRLCETLEAAANRIHSILG